ncbi:hypothetical protein TanjilG_20833 [Lupinus angustifolius]|uniref:Uncharacterized protein n=1 Tax=Lupinus angustifolius TaxID=3871 RepID=A0A4P1QRW0_LUPAN|nr:hypothetical protein TanjilG_20833 [Lupinus angustifolius]
MGIDPMTHSPRVDLLDLSSILSSSLYGSSQMNFQMLFGMQPMVNPELLKLASSLFSSHQSQDLNMTCPQNGIKRTSTLNTPSGSRPFTRSQLIESNVNTYPSNLNDFGSQQHSQINDWHSNGIASSSAIADNYYGSDYYHTSIMDPLISETSAFYSNNSNLNFRFASVLSTPSSSSPKPLNSNSTYINGSSTVD